MRWVSLPSPIGELGVAADDQGICAVRFDGPPADAAVADPAGVDGVLAAARDEFAEYFAADRTGFTLPLSARGGSSFHRAVWEQISLIGYGDTVTYGAIAAAVGQPDGAQAVGIACNRNPLPLVVPCHRVVGAGGKLVGFGGGLDRKRHLLDLEARTRLNLGLFW